MYEFPHQALLGYQKNDTIQWLCGGSLISPDFVLTAAHCTVAHDLGAVKLVKFAVHDRTYDEDKTIVLPVFKIIKHPESVLSTFQNDIALLKLQSSVKIDAFILPACLPTRPYFNEKAIVTGFGETGKGILSQRLMKVVLERSSHQICKESYESYYSEDTMLCYGHRSERKDSCQGDSGGPLQVPNDEQVNCTYTVFGIVSFGSSVCGIVGGAAAYVNVYKYLDWIESIVWNDQL